MGVMDDYFGPWKDRKRISVRNSGSEDCTPMNEYTKAVKAKGWQMQEVAERWGVTPRRMSQIAKQPTQKDWDAVSGLPEKDKVLAQSI